MKIRKSQSVGMVKEVMEGLNLTQNELCRIVGVAPATTNRWGQPNQKSVPTGMDEIKMKTLVTLARSKMNKERIKDVMLDPFNAFPKQMVSDAIMMDNEAVAVAQMMSLLCDDLGRRIIASVSVADIRTMLCRDKEV